MNISVMSSCISVVIFKGYVDWVLGCDLWLLY